MINLSAAVRKASSLLILTLIFSVNAQQLPTELQQLRNQAQQSGSSPNAPSFAPATVLESSQRLPSQSLSGGAYGQYLSTTRQGLLLPGELTFADVFPEQKPMDNPPFAANLFIGGYESERIDGLSDNYLIAAGDKVAIQMWGAVTYSDVLTVDNQGNIFLPSIGPIAVEGTPASQINAVVAQRIGQIYTSDVNIYVNLLTATPVTVFVSGPVIRPGQYAGQSEDSVLYFLKRAGGIDFTRGSFRAIDIKRNGEVIASIDLYDFIASGEIETPQFQDGDTIFVHPIKETIVVEQGARNSFTFEFHPDESTGEALTQYARPNKKITHVSVTGVRDGSSYSAYVSLGAFAEISLQDGDTIVYAEDYAFDEFTVSVEGNSSGPSSFAVAAGTRLKALLNHVEINPELVDIESIHLLRKSVAKTQKAIIEQALQRLERSVFTAPISSTGEGAIRVQEAQLVSDFISRARKVEPLGTVVVADNGHVADILLEPGDTIVIPTKTDLIHVGGEVLMPQSLVYSENAEVEDYIAWSGGLTERANTDRIVIIRGNGVIDFYSGNDNYWLGSSESAQLKQGDQIIVLPRIDVKSLQTIKDITQIIYQIAVAANVAFD